MVRGFTVFFHGCGCCEIGLRCVILRCIRRKPVLGISTVVGELTVTGVVIQADLKGGAEAVLRGNCQFKKSR